MNSEVFSFSRFWTYFRYDLKQMWRNHARAAILIGFSVAILYVLWVTFSLIMTGHWAAPDQSVRLLTLFFALFALELYQTRTYGYLTERKAGSAWLMVPASHLEKAVSMILITVIIIPVLFILVFTLSDWLISVLDPTYGKALLTSGASVWQELMDSMVVMEEEGVQMNLVAWAVPMILSFFVNYQFFLLCGICFKKRKIIGAFAILILLSVVSSLLFSTVAPSIVEWMNVDNMEIDQINLLINRTMNWVTAFSGVCALGLAAGIWYRIKTLQH